MLHRNSFGEVLRDFLDRTNSEICEVGESYIVVRDCDQERVNLSLESHNTSLFR
jgi:hypothetical protein